MRLRDPRLWFGAASLALVLGLFAMDYQQTSPGPLSPSHAAVAELVDPSACDACHGGWFSTMTSSCLECHAEIEQQLSDRVGLHGTRILSERGTDGAHACEACHVEHHGDQLPLAGKEAFALAGLGSLEDFDHGHVEFALDGRHDELGCERCHERASALALAEGETRFVGLEQACTACHEDPHKGRFARTCESCHGQEKPFGELGSFSHGEAFPLTGAHARVSCQECHAKGGDHEVEDLAGHGPPPPARTCEDCHASPHRPTFTAEVERLTWRVPGDSCAACHDAERGPFAGEAAEMPAELHAASGFDLRAPHDRARCEACHGQDASRSDAHAPRIAVEPLPATAGAELAARFPGRSPDDCATCHADPHGGQFDVEPYSRGGCLACHERESFTPHAFGVEEHAGCAFPLEASHTAVGCNDCHRVPDGLADAPRAFRGTARACSACHNDVHGPTRAGAFAASAQQREELGGCATCHEPTRFADTDSEAFEHGRWAGYALDGAHARASCESCHERSQVPDAHGRTLARVEQRFPGSPQRCETCHADPHRGAFEASSERPAGQQDDGCARCHTPEGFRAGEAITAFDHGRWTGFALEGAHLRAECASCHGEPPAARGAPLASTRSFGFVSDRIGRAADSCAACHEDPHRGRFDDDPGAAEGASCERCHSSESFAQIDREAFDHARWTGFSLVGEHARAECTACHAPTPQASQGGARLGPARGSDCVACHVDPHVGQFTLDGRTDCARCHRAEADFHALDFDHQRDTRFALDRRHEKLACAACHVSWPLRDGSSAVRYKPLGTECVDCHDPNGRSGRGSSGSRGGASGGLR